MFGGKLIAGSLARIFIDMNSPANNVKNFFMVNSPFAKKHTLINRKVNFTKKKLDYLIIFDTILRLVILWRMIMECVVKIQLKENAPVKKILGIFKVNKAKERASLLEKNNEYFNLKNVLSIPYGMLGEDPQIVMDFIVFKLTEAYGVPEHHVTSGQHLPCYYINNIKTFLTTANELQPYGIKLDDLMHLTIEEAIALRNDKTVEHSIGFVESRTIIDSNSAGIKTEVKDAIERAEFILYDHLDKKWAALF